MNIRHDTKFQLFPADNIENSYTFLISNKTSHQAKKLFLDKVMSREKGEIFLTALLEQAQRDLAHANDNPTQIVKARYVNRVITQSEPHPLVEPLSWLIPQIESRLNAKAAIAPYSAVFESLGPVLTN